jgi:hypothetical protein
VKGEEGGGWRVGVSLHTSLLPMHNDFDNAAKEILNLSGRAIIPFLNASFAVSHPPDAPLVRTNTEYRIPSRSKKTHSRDKIIVADEVFLVDNTHYYHIEVQLDRRSGMALRMFRYDIAEALEHPAEEDGVQSISFAKSLIIYLEPSAGTPDYESLRIRFPDGFCYEYRTPVIKLTELSVRELSERHLVIFAPLYILKLRRKVRRAETQDERKRLAAELRKIYKEMGEAMKREKEAGNITDMDGDKIRRITEVLHQEVYGTYTEFEEENMKSSLSEDMRIIEKLHMELDEERRSREEERRSREEERRFREKEQRLREEERHLREEAVSRAELDRQRLRDTARNILRLGLSVEQVSQATGLPPETVRALSKPL